MCHQDPETRRTDQDTVIVRHVRKPLCSLTRSAQLDSTAILSRMLLNLLLCRPLLSLNFDRSPISYHLMPPSGQIGTGVRSSRASLPFCVRLYFGGG